MKKKIAKFIHNKEAKKDIKKAYFNLLEYKQKSDIEKLHTICLKTFETIDGFSFLREYFEIEYLKKSPHCIWYNDRKIPVQVPLTNNATDSLNAKIKLK